MDVLSVPYSKIEIKQQMKKNQVVQGIVAVDVSNLIAWSYEQFINELSNRLIGGDLLMDVDYCLVGHKGSMLHFQVRGFVDLDEYIGYIKNITRNVWIESLDIQENSVHVTYCDHESDALVFASDADAAYALVRLNEVLKDAFFLFRDFDIRS